MKRLPLRLSYLGSTVVLATLVACGGISDPTRDGSESVATISGALTATSVPANARVALVWSNSNSGTHEVGSDVPIVNGRFTMDLTPPPDSYFRPTDPGGYDGTSGGGTLPKGLSTTNLAPDPGNAFAFENPLRPRDTISGQITEPLEVAVAGFVVYVDTNNNGRLDIEGPNAVPTDTVIGGNRELYLAYFRDGGTLDYEKLRDHSGVLPHAGYNLAWDDGRWLPLNAVELKISDGTRLPYTVCSDGFGTESYAPPALDAGVATDGGGALDADADAPNYGYPDPNDPNLHCSPDGRSWSYDVPATDCNPSPTPAGLCESEILVPQCSADAGASPSLLPEEAPPPGWPCPVDVDGGPAEDGDIDAGPVKDAGVP